MQFAIRYTTEYQYDAPVTDNLNALRVRPATTSNQRCDEFHTLILPEARVSRYLDYFGTEVLEFGVPTAHQELTIDVRARVATNAPLDPPQGPWESLAGERYIDVAGEFALPWQDHPVQEGITDLERAIRADTPRATVERLCEIVPREFEYRPGATYVGSTIDDLLAAGAGVCQDFAHLSLVLLRRHGIAARYVSGYLWAASPQSGTDSLEVDTHAWIEALLPAPDGEEPVWVSADPTNGSLADESHVKIGHGRFYADVAPIKGLYYGHAASRLMASVTMSRLDG